MDSSQKWPQISGPALGLDISYKANSQKPKFMELEKPFHLLETEKYFSTLTDQTLQTEFKYIRNLTEDKDHQLNLEGADTTFNGFNRYNDMLPCFIII